MEGGAYHKTLRVSLVVGAFVLLFDSGLVSPVTKSLSENTQQYVANAVGMTAKVQPTQLSEITAELARREQELNQREAALSEREISVNTTVPTSKSDYSTYILSVILFILLVLITLNYILDWLRARTEEMVRIKKLGQKVGAGDTG